MNVKITNLLQLTPMLVEFEEEETTEISLKLFFIDFYNDNFYVINGDSVMKVSDEIVHSVREIVNAKKNQLLAPGIPAEMIENAVKERSAISKVKNA